MTTLITAAIWVLAVGVLLFTAAIVVVLLDKGRQQRRAEEEQHAAAQARAYAADERAQRLLNEPAIVEVPIVAGVLPGIDAATDEALALVGPPPTLREQEIEVPRVGHPEGAVLQGRHPIHDECLDHYRSRDEARICRDCWRSFYGEKAAA